MKADDIIRIAQGVDGTECTAKVNWVEGAEAGITFINPEEYKGGASVVLVKDCMVLVSYAETKRFDAGIAALSDEELRESIQRLRGLRFPKKPSTRPSAVKKVSSARTKDRELAAKAKLIPPDVLDMLMKQVMEEEKK